MASGIAYWMRECEARLEAGMKFASRAPKGGADTSEAVQAIVPASPGACRASLNGSAAVSEAILNSARAIDRARSGVVLNSAE